MVDREISSIGRVLTVEAYLNPLTIAGIPAADRLFKRFIRADNGRIIYFDANGVERKFYTHLPLLVHTARGLDSELIFVSEAGVAYPVTFPSSVPAPYAESNITNRNWSAASVSRQAVYAGVIAQGRLPTVTRRVSAFAAAGSAAYSNRLVIDADHDIRDYSDGGVNYRELNSGGSLFSEFSRGRRRVYFRNARASGNIITPLMLTPDYQELTASAFLFEGTRSVTSDVRLSGANGLEGERVEIINASDKPITVRSTNTIRNTRRVTTIAAVAGIAAKYTDVVIQPGAVVPFWRYPRGTALGWEFWQKIGEVAFLEDTPVEQRPGYVPDAPDAPTPFMNSSTERMNTGDRMNTTA